MPENVFWVYNGWAILITVLAPIYMIIETESGRYAYYIVLFRGVFFIISIVLLCILSSWITALLYFPAMYLIGMVFIIIKRRGLD